MVTKIRLAGVLQLFRKHCVFLSVKPIDMKTIFFLVLITFSANIAFGQNSAVAPKTPIMTLGVFHFNYPNLDAVKTEEKDQISVLDEPYKSEIMRICEAILDFRPTIIAIEQTPQYQHRIDSLFDRYSTGNWELGRSEVYQLGFRLGKNLGLEKLYCIDDAGRNYSNLDSIFNDSTRLNNLVSYYFSNQDSVYRLPKTNTRITSVIDALIDVNNPEQIEESLSGYLLHPFKYEESPGDFTGVDFESGRWFNRNLRILRNIQRIPRGAEDRILLIIGSDHLNLLNLFFDISREFELVSPIPYLIKSKLIN